MHSRARDPRVLRRAGASGAADQLGCRASPTPRPRRRGERSAQLAHARRRRLVGNDARARPAHVGWMLRPTHRTEPDRYARDLLREPSMRFISRHYVAIALSGLLLPGRDRLGLGRDDLRGPHGAALGRLDPPVPGAPRHLERELDLPCRRRAPVRDDRPIPQPVPLHCSHWAMPGTTTTTRSRPRPGMGCAGGRSTSRGW